MGEERKVYRYLVGKPEGKRPLGRLRRSWEDGIIMNLSVRETGWGCRVDSTVSGWNPLAGSLNTARNLRVLAPRS
jgi:hypothetical protein